MGGVITERCTNSIIIGERHKANMAELAIPIQKMNQEWILRRTEVFLDPGNALSERIKEVVCCIRWGSKPRGL